MKSSFLKDSTHPTLILSTYYGFVVNCVIVVSDLEYKPCHVPSLNIQVSN